MMMTNIEIDVEDELNGHDLDARTICTKYIILYY